MVQRDLEGFQQLKEEPVVQEIVGLGSSMGLEIIEEEVEELLEDHKKELSFEEPTELHSEEADTVQQRIAFEDEKTVRVFQLRILKEIFCCWNGLSELTKDYHPDIAAV